MDHSNVKECGGFYFISNFDSGNLGHVERVPTEHIVPAVVNSKPNHLETPDYEFNLWTRPDCAGTEFENGNRTWFYFGIQASVPNALVRLNLINLNKQGKMYAQGMAPVTRTLPGKPQWERIRDRPIHHTDDNTFTLSFKYRTSENTKATTFFAFTYPFSFAELQIALNSIDMKMLPLPPPQSADDIYYCRECVIYSLEGRRVDLLTISSHHGITSEREERLKNLFPEKQERPFKFINKKVIFISARVHPGETPSSFVFNGFLNLLLNRYDPIAVQLRRLYVFKMVPFLNPDGVARGHYRTDTRGVNLNRVYLNPSLVYHPTVYASRALIRFYHYGCEKEDNFEDSKSYKSRSLHNISESAETMQSTDLKKKKSIRSSGSERKQGSKQSDLNKSATVLKQPSDIRKDSYRIGTPIDGTNSDQAGSQQARLRTGEKLPPSKREACDLAVQVYDMTLQEMTARTGSASVTRASKPHMEASSALLNEETLRNCLGSNVHLSTSEELKIQGNNPLQPLRQALKNSISLLMESPRSEHDQTEDRQGNVKMGWCRACRDSISKLETSMPGLSNLVPGYTNTDSADMTFTSIDEYREYQEKKLQDQTQWLKEFEKMSQEPREEGAVYFCTNCFKRYILSEQNEEVEVDTVSVTSVAVAAGEDDDSIRSETQVNKAAASTEEIVPVSSQQTKPDKGGRAKPAPKKKPAPAPAPSAPREPNSGLFMYLDLHGHASKKGIFMYGNHFEDVDACVECMLLPRIMALNNMHFHFSSCNFTERNMYLKDRRDGMSREGSGRVAIYKTTGLVRCYTLECNYNTGRLVNVLPPTVRDPIPSAEIKSNATPPKYTPHIYEEVGRALGASILDLTGQHPNSRIPGSEHRNLAALREWLRAHTKTARLQISAPRLRSKTTSPIRQPLFPRLKAPKVTDERKENAFREPERRATGVMAPLAPRPPVDLVNLNVKVRQGPNAPSGSRPRFMSDDSKGKTVGVKRRNALSIRKPSTSKSSLNRARRSADDSATRIPSGTKLSKRSLERSLRSALKSSAARCCASSSSEDMLAPSATWEEVTGGTALSTEMSSSRRRVFPQPPHVHLKKIRLKAAL